MIRRTGLTVLGLGAWLSACVAEEIEPNDETNAEVMGDAGTSDESDETGAPDPCEGACYEGQICEIGTCTWPFDCELTCTSFDPDGTCYCQTQCTGHVEIFTCFSSGECHCQGNDHNKVIEGSCVSEEAAYEIYYRCHVAMP